MSSTRTRKLYEGSGNQCKDLDEALDRLCTMAQPGVPMTFDEMATHLPCSRQNLRMYVERALKRIRLTHGPMLRELLP